MMDRTRSLPTRAGASRPSLTRAVVESRLARMEHGLLTVAGNGWTSVFGRGAEDGLEARVHVHDARMFLRILLAGTLGAAEGYMEGEWTADDLTKVIRIVLRNAVPLRDLEAGTARVGRAVAGIYHNTRRNTRAGSRRNIAAHYDLGNDFFARMLDPTMTYSAALFERDDLSLEEASVAKLERLCQKLELGPRDHLLEIGTGWGSMAIHAASTRGCRVTTTTISKEQHALAERRIREAGLADRVRVLLSDYRDLEGRFDKIVSVEMIEAVGAAHYESFFARSGALLEPGGRLALQAITIRDQRYEAAREGADFIQRYIFPGSCIPSLTALLTASTRASTLVLGALEDLTPHYAETMARWRKNLEPHEAEVVARYGRRFWRMWAYYLAYCEAGFLERNIRSAQLVFDKPRYG